MPLNRRSFIRIIMIAAIFCSSNIVHAQWRDIDSIRVQLLVFDTSNYIPSYYQGALDYNLMIASSKGYDSEIIRLIENGADVNAETDEWATPIVFAVSNNKVSAVKTLLKYDPNINSITRDGETPLLIAVKNNNFEISEALIRAGAQVDIRDRFGATPLNYSSIHGNLEIVDLLLYYDASIDIKSYEGFTPLMSSIWAGYTDIADHLIQNGANIEARDNDGFTPFLKAAYYGDTLMLNILYKKGVDIYAINKYNHNALTLSILADQGDATAFLLRIGKDWINPERNSIDPYLVASKFRRLDLIKVLKANDIKGAIRYGIDQMSLSVSGRFFTKDFYSGISLSFNESFLNGGFIAGCDTKLWYTRVLLKSSEKLYYQYMDKGSLAYAGLFKDFALTDRIDSYNYSISTSLLGGYSFGNKLKGTLVAHGSKFLLIPSVNLKITKLHSTVFMGLEYTKTQYYQNGPVWLRIGYSYNHFLDNVRMRIKPIKWY
jgi:ankyrin repeat protein